MKNNKLEYDSVEGRVIRAESGRFLVDDGTHVVPCSLRGKIKKERKRRVRNVVVGDRVVIHLTGSDPNPESEGVIESVCTRDTMLSRASSGGGKREQVLMANLEQVFIVMATREPDFNPGLLDRFLVGCAHQDLETVICLNKCDLADSMEYLPMTAPYREADYTILQASAETGEGLAELKSALIGRISLFLGPSGAGKSSLLRKIQPGLEIATMSVSDTTGKGRHTTSYTELHGLDAGGYIADSPGVREFGLWGIEERDLDTCFPEFREYLRQCRYPDCTHSHEPDCAIKAAVEESALNGKRYTSYLRILESIREGKLGF
ncbi:MAG: ribosome small subunit-dependent GTPase A [bacterium]|nr:ribosome small subunit-dependent GTPase A [bacterium]